MWSAPDPTETSTMMARPLPESPVGRGLVLLGSELRACSFRTRCTRGNVAHVKQERVLLSSRRSRRHREAVEVSRGRTGRLWRLRAAHLHRPQQSGQLRHHPTTKMWSWRWRSGRRRGAAPLPVCPFESSCRSCTVTQDPWVRAEGAVRGGPRRRRAHGAGPYFSVSGFRLYPLRSL